MKRFIPIILITLFTGYFANAQNNIVKGNGICYTSGVPTVTINTDYHCEFAIDTSTGKIYVYGRDTAGGKWIHYGWPLRETGTVGSPSYTPGDKQSYFAVNLGDSLYFYGGGSWGLVSGGGGGISSNVLSLSGNVMTSNINSGSYSDTSLVIGEVNGNLSGNTQTINVNDVTDTMAVIGSNVLTFTSDSIKSTINGINSNAIYLGGYTNTDTQDLSITAGKGTINLVDGGNVTLNDSSSTNEGIVSFTVSANTGTLLSNTFGQQPYYFGGRGILQLTDSSGYTLLTATEGDGSTTNEGLLSWNVSANLATLTSNTSGSETLLAAGRNGLVITDSSGYMLFTQASGGSGISSNVLSLSGNTMTSNINSGSYSDTSLVIGTNVLASSGNTLTSTINGVANTGTGTLINSLTTTFSSDSIKVTANGINSTASYLGGTYHKQGGNSYGATFNVGSNDNNTVNIEVQDTAQLTLNTDGTSMFTTYSSTNNALIDGLYIDAESYNTPTTSFGGSLMFKGKSSTTAAQQMATIGAYWTNATHANREAALSFQLGDNAGALAEVFKIDRSYNNTGTLYIGSSSALTLYRTAMEAAGVFTISTPASSTLTLQSSNAATAAIHLKPLDNAGSVEVDNVSYTSTSLAKKSMVFDGLYTAASGSGTMTALAINNTYNLTSTASGAQIGIDINPTLTSLTAATYRGINIPYSNSAAYGIYQSGASTLNYFAGQTQYEKELKLKEISAPSTPASGYGYLYAFTDDSLYYINNAGTSINLCRSSGSGGSYTDENAQDAIGSMINASLQYVDGTPLLAINDRDFGDITTSGSGLTFTIDASTITTSKILDSTITEVDLATNSVGANAIKASAVGTSEINDGTIATADLADSLITEVKLITNSVGSNAIKANAVGTSEINDGSITGDDLSTTLTITGNTTFGNSANDLTLSSISGANEGVIYVTNGYVNQYTTNGSITSRINNTPDSIYITSKKIDINADSLRLKLTGAYGTSGQFVKVGTNGLLEFGSGGAATLNLSYDVANHEVDIDGGGTSAVIPLAVADGATEGVASFSATYFDASSGNITPDLTNGLASGSQGGWLSSTNWTTFNSKANKSIYADDGRIDSTRYAQIDPDSAFFMGYFPDAATQTINFDGREIGISFQNELMTIHGRDSALQIWSALAMDEKPTLQLANAALSKRVYLALDTTYFRLHIEHGSDESNIYGYKDSIEVTSKKLFVSVDSFRMKLQGSFGTSGQFVKVGTNGLLTFGTGGGGASTNVLSYGTVTGILTSVVDGISDTTAIPLAAADGATMGIASFTAADFNSSAGNISIDYTNGQAASGSNKGFLTSADWTTFNNKLSAVTYANVTSGSIPDNTLVQALRSRNVAWGYFQNFPSGVNDEDRGIWMDDEVYIYANDSTSGNITRIYSDNGSWLMKVSNGSPNSYLQQTLTKNEFYIDDGTDNTLAFFGSDSIYLRTDRVRVETDSFKMVLSGSSGTNGQVLKSNGSVLYWAADATGGGGLSDGDYGDITVGGSGTTMTVDNDAITSAKIAAGTIVSGDVNDDHIILQGGNTIGETVVVGSNDANAFSIESNNVVRATVTGGASTGGAWTMTDVTSKTNTIEDVLTLTANSTGTAAANYGAGILFQGESSTTNSQDMAAIRTYWTTATHATREAAMGWQLGNAGSAGLLEVMKLDRVADSSGVLSVGYSTPLAITRSAISGATAGGLAITGGTAVTDSIIFKGTTGNGTATNGALIFNVGNNGATNAMTIRNNGNIGIGVASPTGQLEVKQTATATGALKGIVFTGAVNTNQTLSTEIPSLYINAAGRQWATGALTTQREVLITQPTYSFVGASTITNAATVGIAGAPIKSTNATITNTHGLLIGAGAVSTATNSYGLTVNAQTGATNNYAAQFLGGNVGIRSSGTNIMAYLQIGAGTATAGTAPLCFVAGPNTSTAVKGEMNYDSSYYLTKESALRFGVGGIAKVFSGDANNSGTGETDLYSWTSPAYALARLNEILEAEFVIKTNDATATHTLQVYFAGTSLLTVGFASVVQDARFKVTIIRTGSTTARANVSVTTSGNLSKSVQTDLTGLTLSGTNILKITGQATGATGGSNDITAKMGVIKWYPGDKP